MYSKNRRTFASCTHFVFFVLRMPFTTVMFAGTKLSEIGIFSPLLNIVAIAAGSSACSSCSAGTYSIQSGGLLIQAMMCTSRTQIYVDIARAKGVASHMYPNNCNLMYPRMYPYDSNLMYPFRSSFALPILLKAVSSTNLARACGNNQQQACPTSQSTTFQGRAASVANDGSLDTGWTHTGGVTGVCASGDTMTPWWMVDFGYTRSIGGGVIWGRSDGSPATLSRLTGFEIWVGSSSSAYNALGNAKCFTATTTEITQAPYTHAFDCAANGRYLFVVLTTGQCLSMREIEIYSMGEQQDVFLFLSSLRGTCWLR
jgi:hypothetical protein